MTIFSAPLNDVVQGDIVLLEDRAVVCVKNIPSRGIIFLKDTDGQYYYYRYEATQCVVVEEMPVAFA